jgi:hypothetical protein
MWNMPEKNQHSWRAADSLCANLRMLFRGFDLVEKPWGLVRGCSYWQIEQAEGEIVARGIMGVAFVREHAA